MLGYRYQGGMGMHQLLRSTPTRLLIAALGSAVTALFLLAVNPFPSDVYGQTPQGQQCTPGGSGCGTVGTQLVTFTQPGATVQRGPSQPVTTTQARPATTSQQPVALPRTGAGLTADSQVSTSTMIAYGLLALAAASGSAGLMLAVRRTRR